MHKRATMARRKCPLLFVLRPKFDHCLLPEKTAYCLQDDHIVMSFLFRSQQFPGNFLAGFSQTIQNNQQLQSVPLVCPVPQSPNGQIPASLPPSVQPIQLIEYNGVPTIVFGAMYDQLYYSPPHSYVPSPTLPSSSVAAAFTYQTVAPAQTPPFNSLNGQQFFPAHVEIIGQPQI